LCDFVGVQLFGRGEVPIEKLCETVSIMTARQDDMQPSNRAVGQRDNDVARAGNRTARYPVLAMTPANTTSKTTTARRARRLSSVASPRAV